MADIGAAPTGNVVTSGPPVPTILKLAMPTVVAMVSQAAVSFIDTVFCGHLPPEESSNAQGALFPSMVILWIFGGSLAAIGIGTQALTARRFAEQKDQDAGKVIYTAALFTLLAAIAFTAIGYAVLDPVLRLFIPGENVEGARVAARGYLYFRLAGIASMSLTAVYKAFFDGIGKTHVHFVAAVIMNVINIGACWVFIFGNLGAPHMGVRGAGLGALLSTGIGLAIMIGYALHPRYRKRFRPFRLTNYSTPLLKQILRLSIPGCVATVAVMTGFALFARIAARLDDLHPTAMVMGEHGKLETVSMAATSSIVEVLHLIFTACLGFGTATATLVSQCLGEKDADKAERFGWTSVRLGLLLFGALGALGFVFSKNIVGFMSSDPAVQDAALHPMQMMAVVTPIISTAIILPQALFGAGNTKFVMVVELILHFTCLVPLAWLLGVHLDLGIVGLWSSAVVYIVLLALTMTFKFKQGTWKAIKL